MKNINFKIYFVISCISMIIGFIAGSGNIKTVEKRVEVDKNGKTWEQVKKIDDSMLSIAGDGFVTCSYIIDAVSTKNAAAIQSGTRKVNDMAKQVTELGGKRQGLLEQLGY